MWKWLKDLFATTPPCKEGKTHCYHVEYYQELRSPDCEFPYDTIPVKRYICCHCGYDGSERVRWD